MKRLFLLLALQGCNSVPGTAQHSEVRAALAFSVEGVAYFGSAVVQRKSSQKIAVSVPKDAAKLLFRTCHREDVIDRPPSNWTTTFVPVMFLENWGSCIITVSVITQKGNLQHGFIDFTSNETLPATSYCNGQKVVSSGGVTFCQARAGLVQKIDFDNGNVAGAGTEGCPELKKDGWSFTYQTSKGLCIYAFKSADGKTHRLTSRGYDTLEGE